MRISSDLPAQLFSVINHPINQSIVLRRLSRILSEQGIRFCLKIPNKQLGMFDEFTRAYYSIYQTKDVLMWINLFKTAEL